MPWRMLRRSRACALCLSRVLRSGTLNARPPMRPGSPEGSRTRLRCDSRREGAGRRRRHALCSKKAGRVATASRRACVASGSKRELSPEQSVPRVAPRPSPAGSPWKVPIRVWPKRLPQFAASPLDNCRNAGRPSRAIMKVRPEALEVVTCGLGTGIRQAPSWCSRLGDLRRVSVLTAMSSERAAMVPPRLSTRRNTWDTSS